MPKDFFTDICFNQNEIKELLLHKLATAPTSPSPLQAQLYYDTSVNRIGLYDGNEWIYSDFIYLQSGTTTDATQTTLSDSKAITSNTVLAFTCKITASEAATGDVWVHEIKGAVKNVSGTTSLVDGTTDELIAEDTGAANWEVSIEANDTTDVLDIKVTGEASHTIDWTVVMIFSETSI
jgi:hypothetical protein